MELTLDRTHESHEFDLQVAQVKFQLCNISSDYLVRSLIDCLEFDKIRKNMIQDAASNYCSIDLIALNGNSIMVSFVNLHHLFSYVYIETLAGRYDQCTKKLTLFSHTTNNCRLLVETKETRLHIRDIDVGVEVTTSNKFLSPKLLDKY